MGMSEQLARGRIGVGGDSLCIDKPEAELSGLLHDCQQLLLFDQAVLGPYPIGHILNGPRHRHQLTVGIAHGFTARQHVMLAAIRPADPELAVVGRAAGENSFDHRVHARQVLGMYRCAKNGHARHHTARHQAPQAEVALGPLQRLGAGMPEEAAQIGQRFGAAQSLVAATQSGVLGLMRHPQVDVLAHGPVPSQRDGHHVDHEQCQHQCQGQAGLAALGQQTQQHQQQHRTAQGQCRLQVKRISGQGADANTRQGEYKEQLVPEIVRRKQQQAAGCPYQSVQHSHAPVQRNPAHDILGRRVPVPPLGAIDP
jgi:hypothetical protein